MDLRRLPQVDALSRSPELEPYSPTVRAAAARHGVARARERLLTDQQADPLQMALEEAERRTQPSLRGAINLSGVILHTGLGRARLADAAVSRVQEIAASYAGVEFDLEGGGRGDRQAHVRDLLCELTGGEDALIVNNAAAGVFLTLSALAAGREVVLSRGQMVEIGGSFRMPDIVRRSGCRLVEVGCTNKTHLGDYLEVTGPETAAWLRCHPSNYRIVGFTAEPSLAELAMAAREREVRLLDDQGNGALVDVGRFGLPPGETLTQSVRYADVSVASGDKLLGGPQAGLIVGRRDIIREIGRHPLARAVRVDKLSLAALEATLRLYLNGQEEKIPTLRYLGRSLDDVRRLAEAVASASPDASIEPGDTEVGSGSAPGVSLPTWRVGLAGPDARLAKALRTGPIPIVPRIEEGRVWLDPRTLEESEIGPVQARLRELAS